MNYLHQLNRIFYISQMEVSINERINSSLYSDVINSYVDINAVTSQRNIVPGSYKETVVQCLDQTLATLNSAGGQTLFTRFKLTPQVRNATLAQLAQIFFQYVIPGSKSNVGNKPSLGIILKKLSDSTKEADDDAADTTDLNTISEHIKFKLFYDTGFSISSMVQLCLTADAKVSTENFNYQQSLLSLNSLPDFATDNSSSESTLKALVHNEHYRGVGSGLLDFECSTVAATNNETAWHLKFNSTTGIAPIYPDIGIEGVIDLNKGNPLFHNFPIITRNMGELYIRLYMENFLRELKIVYLNKSRGSLKGTVSNGKIASATSIQLTNDNDEDAAFDTADAATNKLKTAAQVDFNGTATITGNGALEWLPYSRLPADKADFIYLDGSLYKIKLVNLKTNNIDETKPCPFNVGNPIYTLDNISWKRFEIRKIEFDIEDYEDIKASQAKAATYKFPVHLFRSKNFDQTNAASSSSNALQTTLNAPNIDRIFITQPLTRDYYTFLPTLATTDINPQLHNNPILPRTEDALNARTCERIYGVFIDTDKHTPPQDLVSSTDIPTQHKQLWLKGPLIYGGAEAYEKLQRGISKSHLPYLLPNKFSYALELNEGGCFRRGFNSVIDGNYSPTVPVNLQQSVQTSDNIYWGETYIDDVDEADALKTNGLWNSFAAYGDIRDSGAVASIHCLCDYIFWINFDAYGNMVDFGVSEFNDRN